jgi:hypothetical protein
MHTMNILVGIHIGSDWNDGGFNCARLSLDDKAIKHIFRLARQAKNGQTVTEFDYTPELGTTELDLESDRKNGQYRDISQYDSLRLIQDNTFKAPADDSNDAPRIDVCQLHVDKDDFWWEGRFKHTDVVWETRMIPLSFLPQELRPAPRPVQSGSTPKADLNMTTEEMNAIHERIAQGISNGLNAREIEATFQRHVTKAQLIRCMIELIERGCKDIMKGGEITVDYQSLLTELVFCTMPLVNIAEYKKARSKQQALVSLEALNKARLALGYKVL